MDRKDAEQMNMHLERMIYHANHVLFTANNCGQPEVSAHVQRVLGSIVANLDLELLEPIYKEFPDLKPEGL